MLPHPFVLRLCVPPTAATAIYTLSLHDALPISVRLGFTTQALANTFANGPHVDYVREAIGQTLGDRKSTRLNSSHVATSYAVFCLKKKTAKMLPRTFQRKHHVPARQTNADGPYA